MNDDDRWREQVDATLQRHAAHLEKLDGYISELRTALAMTATKGDILTLRGHIDSAVNGLLRDALQAMPPRLGLMLGIITVIATVAMVVLEIIRVRPG